MLYSGTTHTEPDHSSNIMKIVAKIEDAGIYELNLKRNDVVPTKDVLMVSAYMLYVILCLYRNRPGERL